MGNESRPAFERFATPPEKMWRIALTGKNGLTLIRYVQEWYDVVKAVQTASESVTVNVVMYLRTDSLTREDILGDNDETEFD